MGILRPDGEHFPVGREIAALLRRDRSIKVGLFLRRQNIDRLFMSRELQQDPRKLVPLLAGQGWRLSQRLPRASVTWAKYSVAGPRRRNSGQPGNAHRPQHRPARTSRACSNTCSRWRRTRTHVRPKLYDRRNDKATLDRSALQSREDTVLNLVIAIDCGRIPDFLEISRQRSPG
jgi:hypothetical protein